jgi:hypothetical protein
MARVPVESTVRAEALQTVAVPKAQAVTARFDPRADRAFQLAEQLGAAGPQLDRLMPKVQQLEQQDAESFVNSMTADQLRKKIDSGELPAWKSPLWVATVQNTAGDNQARGIFREVDSKIANGEFKTPQEVEEFIKARREDILTGKSPFEVAGFDRNFNALKERSLGQMNQVMTKRYEAEGTTVATESLSNRLTEVTSEQWNGKTNQERVAFVLQDYEKHRTSRLINDETARGVLDSVVLKLAATGNKELVDEFLKTKLPNNGPTVETFLDVRQGNSTGRSMQLRDSATTNFNRVQKETNERYVQVEQDTILTTANATADELVAQRNGASMPDVTVPTANGGTQVIKGKDLVAQAVARQVAANPNMAFDEQVRIYKNNGVVNEQWKKEFSTAIYNIGEITIDADGKPKGTLLKGTVEALEKFAVTRQVSEQYAKDLVGEDNYKILNKIEALREAGIPDANQAAGVVNQINRRQYDPKTWGNIQKDVTSTIEDIKNPGIFTGRFWGELFRGEFGEGDKNIIPIEGNMRELAEAYVQARIAPDAKTAVKLASEYLSKTVVQVNNTLYMKSDLPKVPPGENDVDWFKGYMRDGLIPRLSKMGVELNINDLTLIPQKGGQPMFLVTNKSIPLPREGGVGLMYVTQEEIQNWVKGEISTRNTKATEDANKDLKLKQNPFKNPKEVILPSGAALTAPRGVRKRNE